METGRAQAAEQQLGQRIDNETARATEAEQQLQQNINTEQARAQAVEQQLQQNIEHQETFHDNTLAGKGTAGDPLSVNLSLTPGINEGVTLTPDGVETTFPLPDNFVFPALSLVTINGLIQRPGADYTLDMDADTGSKTITFSETPAAGDVVRAYFSASL